jgi:hypothetical protein
MLITSFLATPWMRQVVVIGLALPNLVDPVGSLSSGLASCCPVLVPAVRLGVGCGGCTVTASSSVHISIDGGDRL